MISLIYGSVHAQNLDSLYGVWQDDTKSDSIRVYAYTGYVWLGYVAQNPGRAVILADSLHRFAKKHAYPRASAYGYHIQGVAHYYMGKYTKSLDYYKQTLAI